MASVLRLSQLPTVLGCRHHGSLRMLLAERGSRAESEHARTPRSDARCTRQRQLDVCPVHSLLDELNTCSLQNTLRPIKVPAYVRVFLQPSPPNKVIFENGQAVQSWET